MTSTATTNQLLKLQSSEATGADLLRLWSQGYGGSTAISLAQLAAYLSGTSSGSVPQLATQRAAISATGFSVTVNSGNTWLLLLQDAAYAAGTIVLPSDPSDKDAFECYSKYAVSALTVDGNGNSVAGAPAALTANDAFRLKYDAQSFTWYKVA